MKEQSIAGATESRPVWESLEAFARQGVQRLLQQVLAEEVEQILGRQRYERREGVDATPGYRNGFGKPRRLSAMAGTITVRRPRLRGLEARWGGEWLSGVHGELGGHAAESHGRGLRAPRLLIADGHLGIWSPVGTVFPTVRQQRCWNRRLVNVLDTLPQKLQARPERS
jgi:transposase-like protein